MSKRQLKPGVHEAWLVKRKLKLDSAPTEALQVAEEKLLEMRGVDRVLADAGRAQLRVDYDASVQNLDRIIAVLREAGCALGKGYWSRVRTNWYRSADAGIEANAKKDPWCCH